MEKTTNVGQSSTESRTNTWLQSGQLRAEGLSNSPELSIDTRHFWTGYARALRDLECGTLAQLTQEDRRLSGLTYRQGFDHLGNQVTPQPTQNWQHRLIQRSGWVVVAACICILLWGR